MTNKILVTNKEGVVDNIGNLKGKQIRFINEKEFYSKVVSGDISVKNKVILFVEKSYSIFKKLIDNNFISIDIRGIDKQKFIKLDYSNLRKMKKIFSSLLLTLSIVCFIWASEIDLELFSITVMTIGSGTAIYKTLAIVLLEVLSALFFPPSPPMGLTLALNMVSAMVGSVIGLFFII